MLLLIRLQTYTNGLFTVNCIVLVEGEVIDDVLHVHVRPVLSQWDTIQRTAVVAREFSLLSLWWSVLSLPFRPPTVDGVPASGTEGAVARDPWRH